MLLTELVGVKKYTELTLDQLIVKFAEHANYKKLGNGFFSYVFKHPTKDEVIKFWVKDEAYEKFVKYLEANPSDPHLPKLKGKIKTISTFHNRIEAFPEKIKYVRLELLDRLDNYDLEEMIDGIDWKFTVKEYLKKPEKFKYFNGHEGDISVNASPELFGMLKTLAQLYKVLGSDLDLDIKPDNLMMRGKQIVITDPFYDDNSVDVMADLKDLGDDPGLKHVSGKIKTKGSY